MYVHLGVTVYLVTLAQKEALIIMYMHMQLCTCTCTCVSSAVHYTHVISKFLKYPTFVPQYFIMQ